MVCSGSVLAVCYQMEEDMGKVCPRFCLGSPFACREWYYIGERKAALLYGRRGIAATKIEAKESTPGPACAGPPPPAGDRYAEIHFTRFAFLCTPLAGVEHRKVFRGWIFVFAHTISVP